MTVDPMVKPRPGWSPLAVRLALVFALLGTLGTASAAHADDVDDAFLQSVKSAGIKYSSPEKAIAAGHRVCDLLDQGKTKAQVAAILMIRNVCAEAGELMDPYCAGYFVGASVAAYCPRYRS